MHPDDRELDDEIRGHLALSVLERVERGEDPVAARLAALREFGYIPNARDGMRRVWHSRWVDAASHLATEMRIGVRSLGAPRASPRRSSSRSRSASAPTRRFSAWSAASCCAPSSIAARSA